MFNNLWPCARKTSVILSQVQQENEQRQLTNFNVELTILHETEENAVQSTV